MAVHFVHFGDGRRARENAIAELRGVLFKARIGRRREPLLNLLREADARQGGKSEERRAECAVVLHAHLRRCGCGAAAEGRWFVCIYFFFGGGARNPFFRIPYFVATDCKYTARTTVPKVAMESKGASQGLRKQPQNHPPQQTL